MTKKKGQVSKYALPALILLLWAIIIFCLPVIAGAWRWLGFTDATLGYIFLGIMLAAIIGYALTNERRDPHRKFSLFILAIFCFISTTQLVFAIWFNMVWFA